MVWVYGRQKYFSLFQCGDRRQTSESAIITILIISGTISRRQNMSYMNLCSNFYVSVPLLHDSVIAPYLKFVVNSPLSHEDVIVLLLHRMLHGYMIMF